ncbi:MULTISPECIES: ATP-binding protein [unclassified Microbacterium]|uniref:ATP-binding protein n=1 Tax=unclassified Microbacterium TaxID=2609290 RepID=UPI003017FB91
MTPSAATPAERLLHAAVPGRTAPVACPVPPPRPALARPRERLVAGVAEGLARHLGAPVVAVRALFVVLAFFGGAGVLLYAWCWAFAPRDAGEAPVSRAAPVAWLLIAAAVLAGLGAAGAAVRAFGSVGPVGQAVPLLLAPAIVLGTAAATAAGVWAALVDRRDPARGPRHAGIVRIVAAVVLLAVFALVVVAASGSGVGVALLALLPLAGLAVLASSNLVERWRELSGERIRRIREEQRAEMAAHLHDSVLQTLALIQNRGGASSEVARLARAQERELRAWLYDGDQPADSDLPTDLRDYAAALELDFPVRIDVVAAGASTERASGEVAAAAREAMLNAARHAGGEVSVYLEGRAGGVDVYVRDRGAGFDPDAVPADRLGIRQSIVGRMRRAGGTATVSSGHAGTEIHLRYDGDGGESRG